MRSIVLGIIVLAFAGCVADSDYVVVVGRVEANGDPAMIEAPATVKLGDRLVVTVGTSGNECVDFDSTDVEVHGDVADVTPFDRNPRDGHTICGDIWKLIPHEAVIEFDSAGKKTVVVHGRRVGTNRTDELIELPVSITVS